MDGMLKALEGANQETSSISVVNRWNILKRISSFTSEGDKKRLRQVCRSWRVVVDQVEDLKLKLNNSNFDFVFESNVRKTCPSLVIEQSAGLIPWNFCPFSETVLQIVEVRGEILVDNWMHLLTTCKRIHTLIIQLQAKPKEGNNIISTWNSWSEKPEFEIHLTELSRIFIKGIMTNCDFHYSTIVNLLKTIKPPKLRQFICAFWVDDFCHQQPTFPEFSLFQKSVMDLKQNCPELTSFGWVSALSKYGKNEFWESLLKRGKSVRVIHGSYSVWKPIADLFLNGKSLEEVHYDFGTIADVHHARQVLKDTAALRSQNIKIISLGLKTFKTHQSVDIRPLQLFSHLRELRIGGCFGVEKTVPQYGSRLDICWNWNWPATLEKISISFFAVATSTLTVILDCPQIKEISIRNQYSFDEQLSKSNVLKALNHQTLKWIIVDSHFDNNIVQPFPGELCRKWIYGSEKKSGFKRSFYCLNTSVTRANILENRSVEGSLWFKPPVYRAGYAVLIAQNVTESELQDMKLRYNLKSTFGFLMGRNLLLMLSHILMVTTILMVVHDVIYKYPK